MSRPETDAGLGCPLLQVMRPDLSLQDVYSRPISILFSVDRFSQCLVSWLLSKCPCHLTDTQLFVHNAQEQRQKDGKPGSRGNLFLAVLHQQTQNRCKVEQFLSHGTLQDCSYVCLQVAIQNFGQAVLRNTRYTHHYAVSCVCICIMYCTNHFAICIHNQSLCCTPET